MMSILLHSLCLSFIVCQTKSDYEFDCKPAGVVLCHHFHTEHHTFLVTPSHSATVVLFNFPLIIITHNCYRVIFNLSNNDSEETFNSSTYLVLYTHTIITTPDQIYHELRRMPLPCSICQRRTGHRMENVGIQLKNISLPRFGCSFFRNIWQRVLTSPFQNHFLR